MKKVLFVATVTKHINTFHIPYLKLFKEKGYEVHVASNGDEKIEFCDKHYNLPFERFPLKKNNIKTYKELKKIINENQYEIIHCHTPVGAALTRLAARMARKNGTKVIYTAHGFHFYKGAPLFNWILYYPIEKILAKYTDCLITITQEDYKFAKRKFKKIKQIEHVNGVGLNTERFNKVLTEEEKENKRKELGIDKNDIVFSYVAELNKNKNQILLINIIKKLKKEMPNIKLLLVGNGPFFEKYNKIIIDNKLKENIKLLGRRNDINDILSITDIYLASSIREGLPVNVMEAMYKGLPIVATVNRGHRELVKNNENGYIIHLNNKTIDNFISNIYLLTERKYKSDKQLIQKYTLEYVSKEMFKIYTL